jgi:hypothetical protein
MKGRTPSASERRYIESAVAVGCVVCRIHHGVYTPCEFHHPEGKTKAGAHLLGFGLCYNHHRGGRDCPEYTSRHPYKAAFERRYGTEMELLAACKALINPL